MFNGCVMKLYVMNVISKNVTNTIATNPTSTASINRDDKNVRY